VAEGVWKAEVRKDIYKEILKLYYRFARRVYPKKREDLSIVKDRARRSPGICR